MSTNVAPPPTSIASGPATIPFLDRLVEAMTWLILGFAPLLINVYNVDAYRTVQATYTSIFIIVLAGAWAIGVTLTGRWGEMRRLPFLVPLAGFALLSLGFLFTSPSVPVSGASWINLILYILFFFALSDLGSRNPAYIWRLPIPVFFAFSFNCLMALLQHKGFTFLGSEGGAYSGLYASWPFKSSGAANYFAGLQAPSRLLSAAGTLGNQNVLGGYLTATIPLFTVLPLIVAVSWRRLADKLLIRFKSLSEGAANFMVGALAALLTLNSLVSYAALLATDTRGAWIGVLGALFVAFAVVPVFFKDELARLSRATWTKLFMAALVAVMAFGALAFLSGVTPTMIAGKVMNTWTIRQRLVAWEVAALMAVERPVLGQGIGTYKINYFKYLAKQFEGRTIPTYMHHRYVQAHNDFVQLAAEVGFAGLAYGLGLLIAVAIAIPRYIWRCRPPPQEGLLLMGALLGVFGMSLFAVSGFPFHIAASSAAWTAVAGIVGAALFKERRLATSQVSGQVSFTLPFEARWGLTGALCVFAITLMAFIYFPFRSDELTKEGMELYKQGKVPEAGRALQEAIRLDPERGDARLVMGIVLAMANRYEDAAKQLIRSQDSYDDVTLHYYLGRVYEALSDKNKARREYLKALSYFPEGTDVRKEVAKRLTQIEGTAGTGFEGTPLDRLGEASRSFGAP